MRLLVLRFKLILTCVFRFLPFELCGFYVLMFVGLSVCSVCADKYFSG